MADRKSEARRLTEEAVACLNEANESRPSGVADRKREEALACLNEADESTSDGVAESKRAEALRCIVMAVADLAAKMELLIED